MKSNELLLTVHRFAGSRMYMVVYLNSLAYPTTSDRWTHKVSYLNSLLFLITSHGRIYKIPLRFTALYSNIAHNRMDMVLRLDSLPCHITSDRRTHKVLHLDSLPYHITSISTQWDVPQTAGWVGTQAQDEAQRWHRSLSRGRDQRLSAGSPQTCETAKYDESAAIGIHF